MPRKIRKAGSGTAQNTAFGDVDFEFQLSGAVLFDQGYNVEDGQGQLMEAGTRAPGKWVLILGDNEGPADYSPRRAVERGLKQMLGYIL